MKSVILAVLATMFIASTAEANANGHGCFHSDRKLQSKLYNSFYGWVWTRMETRFENHCPVRVKVAVCAQRVLGDWSSPYFLFLEPEGVYTVFFEQFLSGKYSYRYIDARNPNAATVGCF